jgi:hydroxymethylglutaryl-CoA lyase
VDGVAVFAAASETFSRRNTNGSIAEVLERIRPVVGRAGVPVRGYISTAFVCPFEGVVRPEAVRRVAVDLLGLGVTELSIGDTIGQATSDQVQALLTLLQREIPVERIALHFHDTYGQAVANVQVARQLGVVTFDGSAGGIGGCPYAPGAPGNVATEALVAAFPGQTGVDAAALREAGAGIRRAMVAA